MTNERLNPELRNHNAITTAGSLKKVTYQAMFLMNIILLGFGMIYQLNTSSNPVWNIYGVFILLVMLGNLAMIAMSSGRSVFDYIYLCLFILNMLLVPLLNTAASVTPTNKISVSTASATIIHSIFVCGAALAFFYHKKGRRSQDSLKEGNKANMVGIVKKYLKYLIIFIFTALLIFGVYISCVIITGMNIGIAEIILPEYSLFYGYAFMAISVMVIKLCWRKSLPKVKLLTVIIGALVFIACMLPVFCMPQTIKAADESYKETFGELNAAGDSERQKSLFRAVRFSIPEYIYGTRGNDYNVIENVVFYRGTEGVDKSLKLSFDVYTPADESKDLPGGRSALIRIHGGAWTIGDKGASNFAQVNKYFASQGYVVFDVQYGLYNGEKFVEYANQPDRVMGNFSIDDMFRHLGIFTKFLVQHNNEYKANLNSVFISGGSAGGQLTSAVGLGLSSGRYKDILDDGIKVKGIIPFYPANGVAGYLGIKGTKELMDPAELVSPYSPPCLMYQGTNDGIVTPDIALKFYNAYKERENNKCVLISMPYATHGSDLYFSGYYNQLFMYYMERFMYRYK